MSANRDLQFVMVRRKESEMKLSENGDRNKNCSPTTL